MTNNFNYPTNKLDGAVTPDSEHHLLTMEVSDHPTMWTLPIKIEPLTQ